MALSLNIHNVTKITIQPRIFGAPNPFTVQEIVATDRTGAEFTISLMTTSDQVLPIEEKERWTQLRDPAIPPTETP
jgi:hypothetical protein